MEYPLATPNERAAAATCIERWLAETAATNPAVLAADRDPGDEPRWLIRLAGEEKEYIACWFHLGQRTLAFDTYLAPAPEENPDRYYEYALRAAQRMIGVAATIGPEDALYLRGQLAVRHVDEVELDRILGSLYEYTERWFRPLMRIGYASRFKG